MFDFVIHRLTKASGEYGTNEIRRDDAILDPMTNLGNLPNHQWSGLHNS